MCTSKDCTYKLCLIWGIYLDGFKSDDEHYYYKAFQISAMTFISLIVLYTGLKLGNDAHSFSSISKN